MRRFVSNRGWASLLALLLAFSFASSIPTSARAATVRGSVTRTGGVTPGGDYGDPDANGGSGIALPGSMRESGSGTVGGDSRTGSSWVWMSRLQVLLEMYRGLLFRF